MSGNSTKNRQIRTRRGESSRAAASLLTAPGLAFLAAVAVLAAWFARTGILLLAALFLAAAGLAWLWSRLALAGVAVERRFAGYRYFPGETFVCRLSLANRKPLPLPWVQVRNELPKGIVPAAPQTRHAAALWGYREIVWRIELTCARRGFYPLGPLQAMAGDILGLYVRSREFARSEPIIVYPRIYPLDPRVIPTASPMGEFRTAQRLFQDPTHVLGVREYHPGDSLRRIHWKATARSTELQVKVLAATTSFKVAIFLDVASFLPEGRLNEDDFELAVSAAGSLAAALAERSSPTGLFVNGLLADSGAPAVFAPAAGRERLTEILEALAKVTPRSGPPLAAFIEAQRARLAAGTTLVLIVGRPPEALPALCAELLPAGFRILVLCIGRHPAPQLPENVRLQRIADVAELCAWRPGGAA